jgi:hypothetical protein
MKNLQVALEEDLHMRIRRVALENGATLGDTIRKAVEAYVVAQEGAKSQSKKK